MLRPRLAGSAVALALLCGGLSAPVHADDTGDQKKSVDKDIADLNEELAGTSKQLQDAYRALAQSKQDLVAATAALQKAQAAVKVAEREDAVLATRLAAAQAAEQDVLQVVAKNANKLDDVKVESAKLAVRAYQSGGVSPQLALLLGAQTPDEYASNAALVQYVMQAQHNTLIGLQQQQAGNSTANDRLVSVRAQIDQLKQKAAAHLQVTKQAKARAAQEQVKVTAVVKQQSAAVNTIKAHKDEELAKLAKLKQEQAKLTAQLAARAKQHAGGPRVSVGDTGGFLNSPVPGAPVTSGFGMRLHPIYHYWRLHSGTDFGVACGTPVYAAADGEVFGVGWAGGYGNRVMVDHGNVNGADMVTTYNHLTSAAVSGGHVSRGQLIAYSGTTGASTGCHLHFEVRLNGTPVDPMRYL